MAFSPALGPDWSTYAPSQSVRRVIKHFWEYAADCVLVEATPPPPPMSEVASHVLTFDEGLRFEGLLDVRNTSTVVYGPSVFKPGAVIRRGLTSTELRRLFDIPLAFDSALNSETFSPTEPLPFESAISPSVLAAAFRHIWGYSGGFDVTSTDVFASGIVGSGDTVGQEGDAAASSLPAQDDASATSQSITLPLPSLEGEESSLDSAEFELDSIDSSSNAQPILIDSSPVETVGWDSDSDGDSYMPRRRVKPANSGKHKEVMDWENLDDESTCCLDLESTEETASLTSCDSQSFDSLSSIASHDGVSIDSDSISGASQATVVTSVTRKSLDSYATTASRDTLESITRATIGLKAVKADDAEVPVYLWDIRIVGANASEKKTKALAGFRKFGLRLFWRGLYKDCIDRLNKKFGKAWPLMSLTTGSGRLSRVGKEKDAMRQMLWHATEASWFEYTRGSKVYHFRFPIRYQRLARDGVPVFFEKPGPSVMQPQPAFSDPSVRDKVKPKVEKVIKRRYLARVTTGIRLKSLIKYFAVPKGLDDIRIVYDGTASGLNESVWAPSFWLPTIESLVRALDSNSWMSDRDIGDMFLNFELHESVWPFAGVDVAPILDESGRISKERWYYWVRNAMGFKSSPYNSIKMALIAEEVILGDRLEPSNLFQWSKVVLNLPGTTTYDPSKTWIAKIRIDGLMASVLFTFVDDERVAGATRELTWQASSRLAQIQAYLGIQDAARKVGECLQQPRAWAGAVVHVHPGEGVFVLTSEEKWCKMKSIFAKWLAVLESGATSLDHKELISDRGFLVYVTRAYPAMIPYVKGFHLTAEMWRGNRDADGWKLPIDQRVAAVCNGSLPADELDEDEATVQHVTRRTGSPHLVAPPSGKTPPAPRLHSDLLALMELTKAEQPPLRLVRPKHVVHVFYGFGDASGSGKGSTFQGFKTVHHPSGGAGPSSDLHFRVGVWGPDEESESSNYRELTNLVEDTEAEARAGRLRETELFLFTDNSTAESAFYKGSSSSKKLHALVLRLHSLAVNYQVILHVIHVSGKRMIAQGTDGCSRGVLLEGVMAGMDMLSFIDLDKSAVTRFPPLLDWIRSWTMQENLEPLTPEEWFVEGHGIIGGEKDKHGVWMPVHEKAGKLHLWAPPPAVADAMLEELLKARHKRTDTFHVIVIPRLMSPRWRRLFHKVSDLHFVVPPGASFWPSDMYEPLWVGVVLPFVPHRPWCLKRVPLLVELARKLCEVCKEGDFLAGNILRKLLKLPRRVASLPPSVASGVLHMPRDGHLSDGYSS